MDDPNLILEHIEVPLWVFDVDNFCIPWANRLGLLFWTAKCVEELAVRDMSVDMSVSVQKRLQQYQLDCTKHGTSYKEYWTVYPNGDPSSAEAVFSPYVLPDGRHGLLIQLLYEDVEVTSDSLQSTQALMHTSSMISLYGADLNLKYSNPAARSAAPKDGMSLVDTLVHGKDLAQIRAELVATGNCEIECEVRTIEGNVWHGMSIRVSPDSVNGESSILVSATDITERRNAQQQALNLAYTDSLTGLPNRISILEKIEALISSEKSERLEFGLLFIDLDRFKLINDTLGHTVGDQLLQSFGNSLRSSVESYDTVARLGGDEFVVIIRKFQDRAELTGKIERILIDSSRPINVAGHKLRITPSTGICIYPEHGTDIISLLKHADLAMYSAKALGKQFEFYEPEMGRISRNRLEIENDLATAIETGQFELFYQPKIGAEKGDIVGAEALIRWRHPERGLVSPLEFIPIAEETGMIVKIGLWVLQEACRAQFAWQTMGHQIPVSINISPKQFMAFDFANGVREAYETAGNDPQMLDLEITESVLIADKDQVLNIMDELHTDGVKFSIDDFGTGYSNLAYLQKYPLDSLKIDKTFLSDINDTSLLEIILGMAKILKLKVVAEGVETNEQVQWLIERECDELQGYFFSKPLPFDNLIDYLEYKEKVQLDLPNAA